MLLPVTLIVAAAATLLNIWLAIRVGQARGAAKVSIGDGGDRRLMARMRAQANYVEYTPFFLILLGLIELAHGAVTWLWVAAIVYILARIAHPFGMDRPGPNPLRVGGIVVSFAVLIGLAVYALYLGYTVPHPTETFIG